MYSGEASLPGVVGTTSTSNPLIFAMVNREEPRGFPYIWVRRVSEKQSNQEYLTREDFAKRHDSRMEQAGNYGSESNTCTGEKKNFLRFSKILTPTLEQLLLRHSSRLVVVGWYCISLLFTKLKLMVAVTQRRNNGSRTYYKV